MVSPRETELLAEARVEEWREVILPEINRRASLERQLAGADRQSNHSPWRTAITWLRGRLDATAGADPRGMGASKPGA